MSCKNVYKQIQNQLAEKHIERLRDMVKLEYGKLDIASASFKALRNIIDYDELKRRVM